MKYVCVRQYDQRDCGAACLSTVCKHYGVKISVSQTRELTKTDLNGTNIYGIVKGAGTLGFDALPLSGDGDELISEIKNKNIKFPFIAHIIVDNRYEHYVVVHNLKKNKLIIADPAKGIVKYTLNDFFKVWTGKIITFSKTSKFEISKKQTNAFTHLYRIIRQHIGWISLTLICSIIISVIGVVSAFVFQYIIDESQSGLLNSNTDTQGSSIYDTLFFLCIAVIVLYIIELFLNLLRGRLLAYLSNKFDDSIMMEYYKKIIDLPMSFFGTRKSGEILSRFSNAAEIRNAITTVLFSGTIDVLMIIAGGIFLFSISKILFLFVVILALLFVSISLIYKNKISNNKRDFMEKDSQVTTNLKESIDGIETIKCFNYCKTMKQKFELQFYSLLKSIYRCNILENNRSSIVSAISAVGIVFIIVFGVVEVIQGNLTIGALFTFYVLSGYFLNPFVDLVGMQTDVQTAIVAFNRLGDMVTLDSEDCDNGKILETYKADITFKDVIFNYGYREPVLNKMSLKIKKGEKVGIVGKSGCGKSTFAKLLLRLYDINSGEILIGDYNINTLNKNNIREKISYLSQTPFFFADTITNNLRLDNSNISQKEIIELCKKVGLHSFIMSLPFGYDTVLEENGTCLSGGQKQLMGIVRAFLSKPDILILDEPTSNLDSITESMLEKIISEISSKSLTCIIIAHRLKTVENCDRIYLFDDGKVLESGTHNELLSYKGKYYDFWSKQNLSLSYSN